MSVSHTSENIRGNILVCDDEEHVRHTLSTYLQKHGFNVLLAKDGVECLDIMQKQKPDALLLDIIMPNLDGISVIRNLREKNIDVPILVLSARHELGPTVDVHELSLGQFIPKPIRLNEIEWLLEAAILENKEAHLI